MKSGCYCISKMRPARTVERWTRYFKRISGTSFRVSGNCKRWRWNFAICRSNARRAIWPGIAEFWVVWPQQRVNTSTCRLPNPARGIRRERIAKSDPVPGRPPSAGADPRTRSMLHLGLQAVAGGSVVLPLLPLIQSCRKAAGAGDRTACLARASVFDRCSTPSGLAAASAARQRWSLNADLHPDTRDAIL